MLVNEFRSSSTLAVHGGEESDPSTGAIIAPIHQATTFVLEGIGHDKGFKYSRTGNPTVAALERALGALDRSPPAVAFSTGMAATTTLALALLEAGDHVLLGDVIYGGTTRLFRQVLNRFGVRVTSADARDPERLRAAMEPRTRLVIVESPANPTLVLTDLRAAAAAAHDHGARLVVDNTFMTAALQDAFAFGADLVLYSTTKHVEGHNAALGGAIVARDPELLERLRYLRNATGSIQTPFNAWLTLRGLKTLPLRIREHSRNALVVAEALARHPRVRAVHYPGLPNFPQRDLALAQHQDGLHGGVLSFEPEGGGAAARLFVQSVRLARPAESLGATETMVTHPATMTHASLSPEERAAKGIPDGLIRLSVGLEDPADILADLDQALRKE